MSTRVQSWARQLGQGICVFALLLLPCGVLVAQETPAPAGPDVVRADELHKKADALVATLQRRHWSEVAKLLERAASLRPTEDPLAVSEQFMAGQLFHFNGSLGRAQANFEGAAEQALANGRVADAADAYVTAAIVAKARGQGQQAMELGRKAELLARSPHLTPPECNGILERIVWVEGKQVAAAR